MNQREQSPAARYLKERQYGKLTGCPEFKLPARQGAEEGTK